LTDAGSPAHGFRRVASRRVPLATFLIAIAAGRAHAQAWVPPAGSGSVNFVVQRIDNTGHFLTDGFLAKQGGKSVDSGIAIEADYAITDRWSLSAELPYVFAKYTDPDPPPPFVPFLPVDTCRCWHSGLQDFGLTARYNLVNKAIGLTPSVSIGVPSHDYNYQGEAVIGRNLKELRLAIDAGQRLDIISKRLSVQARYSYAFVQRVLDVPNNRSNAAVEGAFELTRKLSVRSSVFWQHTHGGLRGPAPSRPETFPFGDVNTPELLNEHDRLLRDNNWRVGGAMSYGFSRFDLFASYIAYVRGTNTHAGRAVTGGISWPFELGR
jgi:hypothetical protein